MEQRLNVITLGVEDVPRARDFYERLGWKVTFTDGDIAMFQAGRVIVSLWGRDQLAEDSGVAAGEAGWGGFTLGYAVSSADEVDLICKQAVEAGAISAKPPIEKPFGRSGTFSDPDGHLWEVAWIKSVKQLEDGSLRLST